MSALMRDCLDVRGSHVQKAMRQVRQCARNRQLLADLRYVLISGIATR